MTCKMLSSLRRGRSSGFTLTELAIVMLGFGFIIAAVWAAGTVVWTNYGVYRTSQEVTTSVQNIRDQFTASQVFPTALAGAAGADITEGLDALNLLPVDMRRSPTLGAGATPIDHALNASWPGVAGVAPAWGSFHVLAESTTPPGGPLNAMRLELQGLSQGACAKLLTASPLAPEIGIIRIGTPVGFTLVAQQDIINGVSATGITLPITPSQAALWCSAAGNTNEVDWDFKLHN
jgi:hypothetical protein